MPSRRKCSIERALVLLHLGCCAVSSLSVTRMVGTERQLSSIAAERPTGPPPTTRAKVSAFMTLSVVIPGRAQRREPGIHDPDGGYGFRAPSLELGPRNDS